MNRIIQAVLFDLDGVLVDATEWHYDALNQALALFGATITRPEHLTVFNGLPTRTKLKLLTKHGRLSEKLQDVIYHIKQSYTEQEILTRAIPDFAKELMLRRLHDEGYRLAVCSNAIRKSVELMLGRAALLDYLEFFLSNEDVSKAKPDPEMYNVAIARLGLRADQVMIVEDAAPGIEAARAAGAHVCEVPNYAAVDYARIRNSLDAIERRA